MVYRVFAIEHLSSTRQSVKRHPYSLVIGIVLGLFSYACTQKAEPSTEGSAGAPSSDAEPAGTADRPAAGDATIWTKANGGNGHGYLIVTVADGITWTDADVAATAAGGHLATIATAAENAFVLALVVPVAAGWVVFSPSTTQLGPWLGASKRAATWSWVTGEPWGYTSWVSGQPSGVSNDGEAEDKLQLLALGDPNGSAVPGWNDATDWAGPSYVIEFDEAP